MKECPNCNILNNPNDANYCHNCGYKLQNESGQVIYSGHYGANIVTCNGIYSYYGKNAQYFHQELGNFLNINHFKISFNFWVAAHKDQIVLSCLLKFDVNLFNGKIYISRFTQNYETAYTYQLNQWNYITIEYNYGSVSVNGGYWINLNIVRTLDSRSILNQTAFNGYLYNIEVKSFII